MNAVSETAARLTKQIEQERATRRRAIRLGDVVPNVDAITTEWLSAVLDAAHPGVVVKGFQIEHVSSGTHDRHRLRLSYALTGTAGVPPATLFTKSLPSVESRMVAGITGHARTEGRFYCELRPSLDLEIPRGYNSTVDRESFAAVHVLEDVVATRGAVFCDAATVVTLEMAEAMIDLMADYHEVFFDDPRFDTDLRWLVPYGRWFRGGVDKLRVDRYHEDAITLAADRVPDRLLRRRREIFPATLRALQVHEEQQPTLLHSDVHIGNWYSTADGAMGLCDWQCAVRGHWSRDLAYALSAALSIEDRRSWEEGLVRRYLDRRAGLGDGNRFDDAWRSYRQQMFHALLMWTPTLCHSEYLPSMQPEWISLTMIERMTTAIDDLNSLDAFIDG